VTEPAQSPTQRRSQVRALQSECQEQTAIFRAASSNDPTPCLELFRYAILRRDPAAWDALVTIYRPYLERRILRIVRVDQADLAELTQDAIVRFWRAYTPEHLARARGLSHVLAYWNNCAHSAANDWLRRRRRTPTSIEPLEGGEDEGDPGDRPARDHKADADVARRVAREAAAWRLWELVEDACRDELDRHIARRMFIEEARPRAIYAERGAELGSKEELFKRIRNLKDRLRRIPEVAELLAELS
jgi:DNA-directed RNA polymerase specialized sigma24 family protein